MSSPEISRAASTVQTSPAIDSSLAGDSVLQLDELYQEQLRGAAAEIAAAVAHAVGTPLNVISGRAELIRQDPANALAQVTRIEEQVRKLADGLRDFVEYLTTDVRSNRNLPATRVMAQACSLLRPVAQQHQVELLVDDTLLLPGAAAAGAATAGPGTAAGEVAELEVDQRSVSNLVTLLSWAIRCTAATRAPDQRRLRLVGSAASGGAVFELQIPGLPLPEHWRIERFEASPPSSDNEAFRLVAVCAAIARGQGGKLQADLLPTDLVPADLVPADLVPTNVSSADSVATGQAKAGEQSPAQGGAGVRVRLLCRACAS